MWGNTRFRAPASSPKQSPCNIHAAITMRFAASRRKPARIYAQSNRAWQQPCSHWVIPMRSATTDSRTHRTTHTGTTTRRRTQKRNQNDPSRTRRTQEVPFTAGCSHSTRKNHEKYKVSCSGFIPKTKPMQHSYGHYHALCSITRPTCISLRTWQHQMTTIMQPLQCDLQTRHFPSSPLLFVIWCKVSHHPSLSVFLCDVKSHTTLHWAYRYVMQSLTPPFIECIVMWCKVSHHPSLSVLLCDVKSHTTLHLVYCYVMPSLTPPFIECIVMWCKVSHHPSLSVLLCDVKSHSTLHWAYCYVMSSLTPPFIECIVMWCKVSHHPSSGKSHP